MKKIFVSTFPFSRTSDAPVNTLNEAGFEFVVNPFQRKMTADEIAEHAADCHGIIAGTEDLTKLIDTSKNLKIISRVGIGLDSVPLQICADKGIAVAYTPDAVTDAVVELTIGLLISGSRRVVNGDRDLRKGGWTRFYGKRIGESTVGIVGAGRIGKKVISVLLSLNPSKILVNDIDEENIRELKSRFSHTNGVVEFVSKERIYKDSDFVSLHIPLNDITKNELDKNTLSTLKEDVTLVNTARGGIVNEDDLFSFLKANNKAYACIDVFEKEPYSGPLTELENIALTQHMASCSFDCREKMELEATQNVVSFLTNGTMIADALKDNL